MRGIDCPAVKCCGMTGQTLRNLLLFPKISCMGGGLMACRLLLQALILVIALAACTAIPVSKRESPDLPPVLAQDELLRSYTKIGRIQIVREVYFHDYALDPNLQAWGLRALREEASKMGADAVIFPEVSSRQLTIVAFPAFPATEYRAAGTAIKFK